MWFFFDAIDSGLSVDNIVDVKEYMFKTIFRTAPNTDIYIVVTANEYEFARGEECFDVYRGTSPMNMMILSPDLQFYSMILENRIVILRMSNISVISMVMQVHPPL